MIFWRQKVLLALLEQLPNQNASRIQLVKWLFLLRQEEHVDRYGSFYDFLPYKYGPFSFVAYKDITEMEHLDLIKSKGDSFQLVNRDIRKHSPKLSTDVLMAINKVVGKYGSWSENKLLNYIYENYPWYASKSKIAKHDIAFKVKREPKAIYTIGYEGLSIDAFLALMVKKEIRCVIDLRYRSFSRKYGYSRSILEKRCKDFELKYYHFPQVGIPTEVRKQTSEKSTLWNIYLITILTNAAKSMKSIAEICKRDLSVMLCFEKDPNDCHRHIVAREISKINNLPVIHYNYKEKRWGKELKYSSQ